MKTLRKYLSIIILAAFALASASCSKIHDIGITSYHIDDFSMKGLRSGELTMTVGVHNPTLQFTLENNSANVYHLGTLIGTINATDVTVPARTDGVYPVTGTATLADGMSLLKVMSLAKNFKEEEYTVDVFTTIRLKKGTHFKVEKIGVPLTEFTSKGN